MLQGEMIRHTYTYESFWEFDNFGSLNESIEIKNRKEWWKNIATQLNVKMEEGDSRLKYKEIYFTKVLWKAEFENFERKWKFVFLRKRVIVKTFLVFKVGFKEVEITGTRRRDSYIWEFNLYFYREYVRMIIQFYEMFDAKCWYYPESADGNDRRYIVLPNKPFYPVAKTRKEKRITLFRNDCLNFQKENEPLMEKLFKNNQYKRKYASKLNSLECCLFCGNKSEYCYCSAPRDDKDIIAWTFEMQLQGAISMLGKELSKIKIGCPTQKYVRQWRDEYV
jgi:hypothetical protein